MSCAGGPNPELKKLYRLLQAQACMLLPTFLPPFKYPKSSSGPGSVASQRDTKFRSTIATAMNIPENVCMVLGEELPKEVLCEGHIVPVKYAVRLSCMKESACSRLLATYCSCRSC